MPGAGERRRKRRGALCSPGHHTAPGRKLHVSQAYLGEASLPGKEAHVPHCGLHLEKPASEQCVSFEGAGLGRVKRHRTRHNLCLFQLTGSQNSGSDCFLSSDK